MDELDKSSGMLFSVKTGPIVRMYLKGSYHVLCLEISNVSFLMTF